MKKIILYSVVLLTGCSSGVELLPQPVMVEGKVLDSNRKPVSGVELVLQPMEKGRPTYATLGADGSFKAEAIQGKYAFYFQGKGGTPALSVPEKYREGKDDHTVKVASGSPIEIILNR